MSIEITEPGVYDRMSEAEYHGDPVPGKSLSSSGARKLLPPHCPAFFRHEQLHGQGHKREFDLGHAAHHKVLGVGSPIFEVDADDWRTKAAKEARDAAYATGEVPLLAREVAVVNDMAAAIQAHPIARALFDPERGGKPEQSLFWVDRYFDVWRRARLDWLPGLTPGGRLIVPDYKTCTAADRKSIAKAVANHGYHQQAEWYRDAVRDLGIAEDVAFVFVFQEKTAPYLINVVELDTAAAEAGRARNNLALSIYADCLRTDTWPGYSTGVELISLPTYAQIADQELIAA